MKVRMMIMAAMMIMMTSAADAQTEKKLTNFNDTTFTLNEVTVKSSLPKSRVKGDAMRTIKNMDYQEIIDGINEVMNFEIPMLLSLTEEQVSVKRNSQNRTVKMLVGHLIDSASNNHQRMVRLQYAPRCGHSMPNTEMGMLVFPDYTQDNDLWIELQDYQHEDWHLLVMLLKYYNQHICHVIRSVDKTKLDNYWIDYEGCRVTLDDMICGYINHLNLHFGQIRELL